MLPHADATRWIRNFGLTTVWPLSICVAYSNPKNDRTMWKVVWFLVLHVYRFDYFPLESDWFSFGPSLLLHVPNATGSRPSRQLWPDRFKLSTARRPRCSLLNTSGPQGSWIKSESKLPPQQIDDLWWLMIYALRIQLRINPVRTSRVFDLITPKLPLAMVKTHRSGPLG
jgi:hypothetical protein